MHATTQTDHPSHAVKVNGVGLTETDRIVVETLCRHPDLEARSRSITARADIDNHTTTHRAIQRLENAGVVTTWQSDEELPGTARTPTMVGLTERAVESGVTERIRLDSEKPLDCVEELEQRVADLEELVEELRDELARATAVEDSEADEEHGWGSIDPAEH